MQIINSVLFVAMITVAVYAIVNQHWWQLIYAAFFLLVGLSNLSLNRRRLRHLREPQASDRS